MTFRGPAWILLLRVGYCLFFASFLSHRKIRYSGTGLAQEGDQAVVLVSGLIIAAVIESTGSSGAETMRGRLLARWLFGRGKPRMGEDLRARPWARRIMRFRDGAVGQFQLLRAGGGIGRAACGLWDFRKIRRKWPVHREQSLFLKGAHCP